MDEGEAQVDQHNARQIIAEIEVRLDDVEHSIDMVRGLLDDLAVYLPKAPAA